MDSQRLGLSILVTIISVLNLAAQSDVDRLKSQLKETQDQLQKERSTKESLQWSIVNNGVASEARVDTLTKKVAAATRSASAGISEQVKANNDSALERAVRLKATGDHAAKAAEDASAAAASLKDQLWQAQETIRHNNTTLLITGGFGFLGLLIPVMSIYATRSKDNVAAENARKLVAANIAADHQAVLNKIDLIQAESKIAASVSQKSDRLLDAKVDQIHVLVNSKLTEYMKSELEAREDNLSLLQEALISNTAAGVKPSARTLELIETAKKKILGLRKDVMDRETVTVISEDRFNRRSTDLK